MKYHYLHIHSIDLFKKPEDPSTVYLDSLSKELIVKANGFWAFDDFSTRFLESDKLKISFQKYSNLVIGNRLANTISAQGRAIPEFLYKLSFHGIPGQDPIGVYKNSNLIVSEVCLRLLRIEGLINAESDLIEGTIEEYFSNNRQFFWMTEEVRRRFIENFIL